MSEQETTIKGFGAVLRAVTCKVDPVRLRHLRQDILDSPVCLLEANEWRRRRQLSDNVYFPSHAGEVNLSVRARLRDSKQADIG